MRNIISFIYWFFLKTKNYSQGNEEEILLKLFKNKNKGFFIDVGCHHPKRFSNTAALYRKGWSGINLDADLKTIRLFKFFRKRDINLNHFISKNKKEVEYNIFDDNALNGSFDNNRIEALKKIGYKASASKQLKTKTLNEIIEKYKPQINLIDLLDIDVEGYDFDVLQSINLKKYNVYSILIEVGNEESEIDSYLNKFGYVRYISIDRNKLYIKKYK
tara:strand:+ start:4677 stop:5327 length:651 start_codon:yes stop_codon:yes gene_type:complete